MITYADVAVELKRPLPSVTAEEQAQWTLWISDAAMLISKRLGDLAGLDQPALDYVLRQAVKAAAERPEGGAVQTDEQIGGVRLSRRYERAVAGSVAILPEWFALLDTDLADPEAFSVRPFFDADTVRPFFFETGTWL